MRIEKRYTEKQLKEWKEKFEDISLVTFRIVGTFNLRYEVQYKFKTVASILASSEVKLEVYEEDLPPEVQEFIELLVKDLVREKIGAWGV